MCVGIPARVVEISSPASHAATVDVEGVRRQVNTIMVDDELSAGDWVLLHVGFALAIIDEDEAMRTLDFMRRLGSEYDDEVRALASTPHENGPSDSDRREIEALVAHPP